jgi:murein DD-endopeptidase MepM/ murein hydrolase activator NlpD
MARTALVAAGAALCFCAPAAAKTDGPAALMFVWPADGTITSPFGDDNGRWHPGIDIGILRSLDVRAATAGVVTQVGAAPGYEGYGNVVIVRVTPQLDALYAHLSSASVRPGDRVLPDQPIATAGCTGWCSGTHLHFELRLAGRPVDPLDFLG